VWWAFAGLGVGLLIGLYLPIHIPVIYARYLSIAIFAALDTAFGGMRAGLEGDFDYSIFISGFFSNILVAALLTYIGDRLGMDIYIAVVFALGYRMFQNVGRIRHSYLKIYGRKRENAGGK
jgi:small basic protein